jgi:hypothetical protein
MESERLRFWEERLGENQQILTMLDAGQFRSSDGGAIDEKTLAEVRKWATRRVAECKARIAEWTNNPSDI